MAKVKPMKIVVSNEYPELAPDILILGKEIEDLDQEIEDFDKEIVAIERKINAVKAKRSIVKSRLADTAYSSTPQCEYIKGGHWNGRTAVLKHCCEHRARYRVKIDNHKPQCVCAEHYELLEEIMACDEHNIKQLEHIV
jgi:hypothetical protein